MRTAVLSEMLGELEQSLAGLGSADDTLADG